MCLAKATSPGSAACAPSWSLESVEKHHDGTEGLDISASAMGSSRRAAQPLRLRRELEREYEAADLVPAVDPAVRVDDLRER